MARVMKLDEIADDVGLDVNGDALLARGEQLVKLEVCFLRVPYTIFVKRDWGYLFFRET